MITGKRQHDLLFGPYEPPSTRRGRFLVCEMRGTVKVGEYSDGPIPWPMKWGTRSIILYGSLLAAVKRESKLAVARQWGVSEKVVYAWRHALGVEPYNEDSLALMRLRGRENATPRRMRALATAARRVTRRPKSKAWRQRMSVIVQLRIKKARGHRSDPSVVDRPRRSTLRHGLRPRGGPTNTADDRRCL
jgi:hypothetical protein